MDVLHYLGHYLQNNWTAIGNYLWGGAAVALVAEILIRWHKFTKTGWKELLAGVISGITALSDWVINNYATSPLVALGNIGPRIFASAVLMHRILINPIWKQLEKSLTPYFTAVKTLKAETTPTPEVPVAAVEAPEQFPL